LEPGRPKAWVNLAAAETALGHLERAREALERVAQEHPRHPDVHYNLATLYLRQSRPLLALAELELELAAHPRHRLARALQRKLLASSR
jgi:tetratricopeptide (TPR) repeat protein